MKTIVVVILLVFILTQWEKIEIEIENGKNQDKLFINEILKKNKKKIQFTLRWKIRLI